MATARLAGGKKSSARHYPELARPLRSFDLLRMQLSPTGPIKHRSPIPLR